MQGLAEVMVIHKSRLEKEKDALAAKKASGVVADGPIPGYMKATASFKVLNFKNLCFLHTDINSLQAVAPSLWSISMRLCKKLPL